MSAVPAAMRALVYERDGHRCYHCGTTEGLGLQHRVGRGMGGSKLLDIPSNLLTFCNAANADMEANAEAARIARQHGWKLHNYEVPYLLVRPVYDRTTQEWFFLDDQHHRTAVG